METGFIGAECRKPVYQERGFKGVWYARYLKHDRATMLRATQSSQNGSADNSAFRGLRFRAELAHPPGNLLYTCYC